MSDESFSIGSMGSSGSTICTMGTGKMISISSLYDASMKYANTKPIFITRLPHNSGYKEVEDVKNYYDKSKLSDEYHIIVLKERNPESLDIRFEIFNCSEMTDTGWNDLVNTVLDDLDPDRILRRESDALFNKIEQEIEKEDL